MASIPSQGDSCGEVTPPSVRGTSETDARSAVLRHLPPRYQTRAREVFHEYLNPSLHVGARVLDVGSGRTPTLEPLHRPLGCHYVGLDVSADELARAPAGSYDEVWVADIASRVPKLDGRFDLVTSWQVLEHVKPVHAAIENARAYLQPGGRFVSMLSGSFAVYALLNRIVPEKLGVRAMEKLHRRDPETVFPARYDHCWYGALSGMLNSWDSYEIVPLYSAAVYFGFSPLLRRLYLTYEDWAYRGDHKNLATHYIIAATR